MTRSMNTAKGFTLVEMIMVIVITGILGGMVAMFLKAPIQQYMDVGRRADMTDVANTASRRVVRDVRLALPNSVRQTPLKLLPMPRARRSSFTAAAGIFACSRGTVSTEGSGGA